MRINFFEEYPTQENLAKAKLIDFPSTIFLAAHSLEEFHSFKKQLHEINPNLTAAYWPLLPHTYWISPFSYTKDLKNFIADSKTNTEPLTILIDLELPLVKKAYLYFVNIWSVPRNKKILKQFFLDAPTCKLEIVTAEYLTPNNFVKKFFHLLGIMYDTKTYPHRSCAMYYTSMIPKMYFASVTDMIRRTKKEPHSQLELGLGTIATGVMGNEPILSPEKLQHDLGFMRENNFTTATIFRLGGFNQEYHSIVKPFTVE